MRSYSPQFQPDELTLRRVINRLTRGGTIPIGDAIARLDNPNQPTPLLNVPYFSQSSAANVPVLLVPKNRHRLSLTLIADFLAFYFSFGPPITAGGRPIGVPLGLLSGGGPHGGFVNLAVNGTVPIDDVWVWNKAALPNTIVAFEGVQTLQ